MIPKFSHFWSKEVPNFDIYLKNEEFSRTFRYRFLLFRFKMEKTNAISEILAQALKGHLTLLRMTRFWCFFRIPVASMLVKKMGAQKSRARNG